MGTHGAIKYIAALACIALVATSGHAAIVSVNFAGNSSGTTYVDGFTGAVGASNWNNADNFNYDDTGPTEQNLTIIDSDGNDVAGMVVSWKFDAESWGTGISTDTESRKLYHGRFDFDGTGDDLDIVVTDIPYSFYHVYVYYMLGPTHEFDLSLDGGTTTRHILPVSQSNTNADTFTPWVDGMTASNYVRYGYETNSTLTITTSNPEGARVGIVGVQIEDVPMPNALGLGLVLLLFLWAFHRPTRQLTS